MLLKKVILILVATCMATGLYAADLTGYVIDATSGEPLPVASIVLLETNRGAATNLDGYFIINDVPPGNYKLKVSYVGYETKEFETTAYMDYSQPLKLEIAPTGVQLKEVEVVYDKDHSVSRAAPRVSTVPVDAKLVRTMPSMAGEMDVLRALQTIPGVKSSSDISSALYVRGGSPDQTLILMDHNTVYNPAHLFGIFSTFNADAVKHLELMKGAFPASYGGRSGSVLEVITNDGNRRKTEGMFSLGLISARGSVEGPLPNEMGSYALSLRRTYMEPVLNAMRKSQDIDLPSYYFYDANAKGNVDANSAISLKLADRTTLSVAGYWGNDRLEFDFGPDDSPLYMMMSWGNRTLSGRVRHALGTNKFLTLGAAVSRYRSKWLLENDGVLLDKARDELYDYSYKSDLEMYEGDHHIKTGFWVSNYDIFFKEESEDLVFVDVNESVNNYSVYVQDSWRMHPMFELQPGIRAYFHDAGDHFIVDPRLTFVYHYDESKRFKVAGGRYSQFMNLATFGEGFASFDLWIPIDHSMEVPYSNQIVFGFEWDREDNYEFTNEYYYTDMNNIATFDPMTDSGEDAGAAFVQGEGYAWGAEWMLRKNRGRLTGWLGYSLSYTKRKFPGSQINDGKEYYPKWDRRHDFIAMSNYKLSRAWDMSASWRLNTGQGFTQANGMMRYYYADVSPEHLDDYGRVPLKGSKNNYRFPEDHRLDLTFTWNHLFMKLPAKLNISIYNAYSRRPYWLRVFNDPEDPWTEPTEVTDVKLLPILPLVSYEVRF